MLVGKCLCRTISYLCSLQLHSGTRTVKQYFVGQLGHSKTEGLFFRILATADSPLEARAEAKKLVAAKDERFLLGLIFESANSQVTAEFTPFAETDNVLGAIVRFKGEL